MRKRVIVFGAILTILSVCSVVNIKADNVEGIKIHEENFPDDIFIGVAGYHDSDKNGYLSKEEVQKITTVYYDGGDNKTFKKVKSLKGIEYFTNLQTLYISETQITSLDLSENKNLTKVEILNLNFQELKLPKDNKITKFRLYNYKPELLDLSVLSELSEIHLSGCQNIKTLDLSLNHKLKSIILDERTTIKGRRKVSRLKTINIGNNDKLKYLDCDLTNLETLKIGKAPALKSVYIKNSKKLKSINTIHMPELRKLNVDGCGLKTLNVSKNLKLQTLSCSKNKLKKLKVTKNKALLRLYCNNNKLIKLNIKSNIKLKTLKCDGNRIRTLDLSKNKKLSMLSCKKNKIKKLNIRKIKLKAKKVKCDKKVKIFK